MGYCLQIADKAGLKPAETLPVNSRKVSSTEPQKQGGGLLFGADTLACARA